jgi:hypothetical protein
VPHRIGHIDPVNRLALLLLLLLGLIGRAHAAPDVGLYDAVGRLIALPAVKLPGSATRNAAGLPAVVSIGDLDTTYTYTARCPPRPPPTARASSSPAPTPATLSGASRRWKRRSTEVGVTQRQTRSRE